MSAPARTRHASASLVTRSAPTGLELRNLRTPDVRPTVRTRHVLHAPPPQPQCATSAPQTAHPRLPTAPPKQRTTQRTKSLLSVGTPVRPTKSPASVLGRLPQEGSVRALMPTRLPCATRSFTRSTTGRESPLTQHLSGPKRAQKPEAKSVTVPSLLQTSRMCSQTMLQRRRLPRSKRWSQISPLWAFKPGATKLPPTPRSTPLLRET